MDRLRLATIEIIKGDVGKRLSGDFFFFCNARLKFCMFLVSRVDEFVVITISDSFDARLRSYDLLADAFALAPVAVA